MIRCYVYQSHPQREQEASAALTDRGFKTLAPRMMKRVERHNPFSKKKKLVTFVPVPLFPRYGFVWFDRDRDEYEKIFTTPNVSRLLVTDKETPIPMPENQMERLLKRIDAEGFWFDVKEEKPWSKLEIGQMVRVADGPFTGFPAKMAEIDSLGRIKVLVGIFGREAPYGLHWDQVEAL